MKKSISFLVMMVMCFVLSTIKSNAQSNSNLSDSKNYLAAYTGDNLKVLPESETFVPPALQTKTKFKFVWSIYAGWNPWEYAKQSGILDKWANKYGIQIELERLEYGPSIDKFMTPSYDAIVITNMDVLMAPVTGGIDCTSIIMGDFSNGNDALISRDNLQIADATKYPIYLVEKTVSEYLLFRMCEINPSVDASAIKVVNTSETEITSSFITNKTKKFVTTWNPWVMEVMKTDGMTNLFNSSKIPGEILDLTVVKTDVLNANPNFAKALVGAWYEVMNIMSSKTDRGRAALNTMAQIGGSSLIDYQYQLKTTAMFYTAKDAADYTESQELQDKMMKVRNFVFKRGWLGNLNSPNDIGIQYTNKVVGSQANILFRFDSKYMRMAERGEL
jgi:NitT/TauT family transport system substrate-binding protein